MDGSSVGEDGCVQRVQKKTEGISHRQAKWLQRHKL